MVDYDAEYARLRASGQAGWGGERYGHRLAGWIETVGALQHDVAFPKPPAHLLELGCGNGMVSMLFSEQGYDVEGVDRSQEAVSWAIELFASSGLAASFRQGDVCSMPFYDDGKFDAVVDGNCLYCIIGGDRRRCLAEARRVLRAGGAFVVSTMCGDPKSDEARARFDAHNRCLVEAGRPYRTLKLADDIAHEVAEAGFRIARRKIREDAWWDHLIVLAVAG